MNNLFAELINIYDQDIPVEKGEVVLDWLLKHREDINNIEKSEKEIKDIIRTRIACAGLSYQIYKYEKRKSIDHAPEVLNWKEICIGKKSSAEFVEVRKVWFE